MGQEKCKSERAPVARAQGVPEARSVERGISIAEVHGRIVDKNLVRRARDAAGIGVLSAGDAETGIEALEIVRDLQEYTARLEIRVAPEEKRPSE